MDLATDQERSRSTVSTRSRKTVRNDGNGPMIRIEEPPITRLQLASFQKRTRRTSVSAIDEGRPIKQGRKANTGARRGHIHQEHVQSSGRETDLDLVLDLEAEADSDPERDSNQNPGMGIDLDLETVSPAEMADTRNTRASVGEFSDAKDNKAMEESILRLRGACSRLQDYENELSNEREACTSLDTMIAKAEEAIVNTSKERDDAIEEVLTAQTDLVEMQKFAKNLSGNMQATMNKSIEEAGRVLGETVKKRDKAEKNLQMKQEELKQHINARKTAQNYMNLLPTFIKLCKDEINTEKEHQQILFLRRDLRFLNPEGLNRIFDAGLSKCRDLMSKIQEEKI
ncbi:hypothetical protein CEP52_016475 [Fusarium oligoseptatum]|uniref:Uncharacterized protein n=1 Tax=Fusarium oligoseptatum TaxID=2604345 RepID=A0A428S3H1_9HYPO|nr:hypothetical protein CEP52_016475 [Fusarium oligoseptatum]